MFRLQAFELNEKHIVKVKFIFTDRVFHVSAVKLTN